MAEEKIAKVLESLGSCDEIKDKDKKCNEIFGKGLWILYGKDIDSLCELDPKNAIYISFTSISMIIPYEDIVNEEYEVGKEILIGIIFFEGQNKHYYWTKYSF